MDKALLDRVQKQAWFHRFPRGFPFLLFVLATLGTLMGVYIIERADEQRRQLELDRNLTEIAWGIKRRAAEAAVLLRAGAALFETQPTVSREQFDGFAAGLQSGERMHGSFGMGWARLIPVRNLAEFEIKRREGNFPDYTVFPRPGPGAFVTAPIVHMVPSTNINRQALGFDMYSEPKRRAGIEASIKLDEPVASGKVTLAREQDNNGTTGFIWYMPVHTNPASNVVKGFVFSPVRAEQFVTSAAELDGSREVDIALYDGPAEPENLLAERKVPGVGGLAMTRTISVGNRTWTLRVQDKKATALTSLSRLTLLFGAIAALLVMAIGRLITKRALEDREVMEFLTRQASIRDSLTRELNHRVKNTLANVLSIATLTMRRSKNIEDFSESFTGRIQALSATHDLLSQTDWRDASLSEIIQSELAPYLQGDSAQAHLSGPDIWLAPNDAMSLGLAIHELATNAAKYGALSNPDGSIYVNWSTVGANTAQVQWREEGGPPVVEPERRGFGRDLLEKIVAHELGSSVDLRFEPEGVQCSFQVPIRKSQEFRLRSQRPYG